jgi:glyoxylase-like metal-dependent hydrolase (beta-lactamase superfamily II)
MVTADGIVLIDTPWDEAQFQPLLDSIEARHNKKVLMCIATHFHDDRTAGLTYYQSKGIPTYTSKLTYDLSREKGEGLAEHYFVNDTVFRAGGKTIEVFYPGEGHTKDNVVVWFKEDKVLYGGCLVKSTENNSLGNIADANIPAWSSTIQNVIDRFPKPAYVVPGHFGWSRGRKALRHTLSLLRQHKQ